MLKDYCVSCGEPMKNSPQHFKTYGNYCKSCNGKCGLIAEARIKMRRLNDPLVLKNPKKVQKNKEQLAKYLEELKRWDIDLAYLEASQSSIDAMNAFINN